MAIDTASKRFSMMSFGNILKLIPPDGTLDQGDRQTFAGLYSGILAGVTAPALFKTGRKRAVIGYNRHNVASYTRSR